MNLANIITSFRIFLIPIFIFVYFKDPANNFLYSVIIFLIAGVSDLLDGYIARKQNIVTTFGTIMDPLADKLMLLTVLISYAITGIIPKWIIILILAKELAMGIGAIIVYRWGIVNPANNLGKIATFSFHVSVVLLLFNKTLGTYMIIFSTALGFIAGLSYIKMTSDKKSVPKDQTHKK